MKGKTNQASLWNIVHNLHYENNGHHNYKTRCLSEAFEIALDFFSSILVKFEVLEIQITSNTIDCAGKLIRTWNTFRSSSFKVKEAFAYVEFQLYKHFKCLWNDGQNEERKTRYNLCFFKKQRGNFSNHKASDKLISFVESFLSVVISERREVDILLILLKDLCMKREASKVFLNWQSVFDVIVSETAAKRFFQYFNAHRTLMFKFHSCLKNRKFYSLKDQSVLDHDNDKLEPFMFLVYTLKQEYREKLHFNEHEDLQKYFNS